MYRLNTLQIDGVAKSASSTDKCQCEIIIFIRNIRNISTMYSIFSLYLVDVWMPHFGQKFHGRRWIWIVMWKFHQSLRHLKKTATSQTTRHNARNFHSHLTSVDLILAEVTQSAMAVSSATHHYRPRNLSLTWHSGHQWIHCWLIHGLNYILHSDWSQPQHMTQFAMAATNQSALNSDKTM